MAAPTIPASNSQAVQTTGGGTTPFTPTWYTFFTNLLSYITSGPIGPVPLVGVTDGSNAAAGNIGEYLLNFRLSGAAVNLLNNTDTQITSLALTAGDWDLWGEIFFLPAGGGLMSSIAGALNTTVSTAPAAPADGIDFERHSGISNAGSVNSTNGLRTRVSITTPTTYLLVANCNFTSGTVGGYGALRARRMR